jgi:hypothetical protein
MLFDLRGRGRRRSVQAIYVTLAILMGGGFVLLGVGSNTSGGGLLDAFKGGGGGGTAPDARLDKQLAGAAKTVRAKPKDPAAWANLARLRVQRASLAGLQSATGKQKATLAYDAWQRYVDLNPTKPDVGLASLIAAAYGPQGLNDPKKAVGAVEVQAAGTKPPNSNLYAKLAVTAYQARRNSLGDLAGDRAVKLAAPSQRKLLREALKQQKAAASSPAGAATTTPGG